jgi:hypothetical protein
MGATRLELRRGSSTGRDSGVQGAVVELRRSVASRERERTREGERARVKGEEESLVGFYRECQRGNSPAGWWNAPTLNPKMRKGLKRFACLAKRSPST